MPSIDIVFLQQYPLPYFGITSLMSYLKHSGYDSEVIIDVMEKDSVMALSRMNPLLIGISVMSTGHSWLIEKVKRIRKAIPQAKIIVGGMHAILYPKKILQDADTDFVCNSEGEYVLLELIRAIKESSSSWNKIKGLSYRDGNGQTVSNERAELFSYENGIVEDHQPYYQRYPQLLKDNVYRFISSRGCPYKCSFCYNANIMEIFNPKGTYVRRKEILPFLEEIGRSVDNYRPKTVYFYDDLFTFDKKWLSGFLAPYKKTIGIPFMCNTRADLVDEETVRILADSGCRTVSFGIETGNYLLRKNVLKRDITNEQIIRCGELLKKHGLYIQTTNMFCLPDETVDDAHQTITLNIKANTDFAFSSLFMPFPDLTISDYCIKKGYLDPDFSVAELPISFMRQSILRTPHKEIIINIQRMSFFFVRIPLLYKVTKRIVEYKCLNFLFYCIYLWGNILRYKEERAVSFVDAMHYAWRIKKYF